MKVTVTRARYESNVRGLGDELNAKLERIVARAARDGAAHVRAISNPSVSAHATEGDEQAGVVTARVFVPPLEFWATMFDKGTLGKRELPLKQPGRQEREWKIRRRGKTYTAHRSAQAAKTGGIKPQYFMIRGKRFAEQQLAQYLRRGI